jgi:hypothetical protein
LCPVVGLRVPAVWRKEGSAEGREDRSEGNLRKGGRTAWGWGKGWRAGRGVRK